MVLRLSRTIILGAMLTAAASWLAAPAMAQDRPIAAADLPQVMTAYAETAIDLRNIYAACSPRQAPDEWEAGAAILVESLRAAGVPAHVVTAIEDRLASPLATEGIDCAGADLPMRTGVTTDQDWADFHRDILRRAGVAVVEPGVTDEKLEAARKSIEAALAPQAEMLVCLSLLDPLSFITAYQDWNELIDRLGNVFAAAGYSSLVYRPILEPAASARLFALPADRAAAIASCAAQQDWADRAYTFGWFTLLGEVAGSLGVANP